MKKSVLSKAPRVWSEFELLTREEARERWLTRQEENPKKTKHALKSISGGKCCLGNACEVLIPFTRMRKMDVVLFDGHDDVLPQSVAKKLGITGSGEFNRKGMKIFQAWKKSSDIIERSDIDSIECLAMVNDGTNANHKQIGLLIKELFKQGGLKRDER